MILGLTGTIGSGKSAALAAFESFGAETIDTDALCRDFYNAPESDFVGKLRARWGGRIFRDGAVDRREIGRIVFNDPAELEFLTGLIYPELRNVLLPRLAANRARRDLLTVVEIPLLYECGYEKECDAVAVVWAERAIRHERLRQRGLTDAEIAEREAKQLDADKKLELADYGIINNGSIEQLEAQCRLLSNLRK